VVNRESNDTVRSQESNPVKSLGREATKAVAWGRRDEAPEIRRTPAVEVGGIIQCENFHFSSGISKEVGI